MIARMAAIEAVLGANDGVARFNDLYLAVTREVDAEARSGTFEATCRARSAEVSRDGAASRVATIARQAGEVALRRGLGVI